MDHAQTAVQSNMKFSTTNIVGWLTMASQRTTDSQIFARVSFFHEYVGQCLIIEQSPNQHNVLLLTYQF